MPKSQHRAWLAQLRRLIKESRKLTPRELLTPCTINQFGKLVPLNELVPLRNEIHECFERIGPLVAVLYAEEREIPWDSFNLRLGDYLHGKKKLTKQEDIIIFKRGIRASTRILIQAAKRIKALSEVEVESVTTTSARLPFDVHTGTNGQLGNVGAPIKSLSERDEKLHDLIGAEKFLALNNVQIRKDYRKSIETYIGLQVDLIKGWEALRSSLNRIRSFHGYPKSNDLRKSVRRRIVAVKNGQSR